MRTSLPLLCVLSLLLCLTARPVSAQLLVQGSSRSVTLMGSAGAGPEYSAYAVTNTSVTSSPYSYALTTNASAYSVGTGPYGLDVSAYSKAQGSQNSLVSSAGFSFNSSLLVQTWSDLPTWGGATSAYAESKFQVSFYVPLTLSVDVQCNASFISHDYPMFNYRLMLSTEGGGAPLLDWTRGSIPLITGEPQRLTLSPDTLYTLNLVMSSGAYSPDPLGEMGGVNSTLSFTPVLTPVPEPASGGLVLLGLLSLGAFRKGKG